MANINNSIFKQYLGTLDEFKAYYAALDSIQQAALSRALVFIHDKEVDGAWNNDGYIFANGKYYACRESAAGLTLNTLLSLIETGDTSGVDVVESDGKLVFTPVIKDELKALTSVGFVEPGKIWAARTPIEDILNDIFAKEIWYKAEFKYADDLVVTMNKPTLTVTVGGSTGVTGTTAVNGSTYEIGAPITVSGSMNASDATGTKFTVTCLTTGNNGFVTNGATSTKLTSLIVGATLSNSGSDALSVTAQSGAFKNMTVSDDNTLSDSNEVTSGTNSITLKSTSKSYTLTATPATSETTLTTLSNKGNYSSNDTEDDVSIKHTVKQTKTLNSTPTSSISFTGAYKYYYVWSAASQPNIPTDFSGDLEGWDENWGTKTINTTATAMNDIAWVLKPSGTAPTIVEPTTGAVTSFETISTHTNKYGTSYTLYRFPKTSAGSAGGANYKDMKLN